MQEITAINRQVKNQNRASVFVEGSYCFSLTLDQLTSSGLKIGDQLDQKQIEDYKKHSLDGKLSERALQWALRRSHSAKEIRDYLAKKTDDEKLQQKVFDKLKSNGFVDDKNFAFLWVESRQRRGYSNYVIRAELYKKGVDQSIIDELLSDKDQELKALRSLIAKKSTKYSDQRKLMAYLASKGYGYDLIKQVLEEDA